MCPREFDSHPAHISNRATLAQLVEQHFCKVKVPGPNPGGGSSLKVMLVFVRIMSVIQANVAQLVEQLHGKE